MKLRLLALLLFIASSIQAQSFHDTQGKLEISSSGQSTYTLPIALPASIQSVGPTINLNYTSGQAGGIAGQGWNINSISFISRMSTRRDIDGFIDGVDFDADDKLAFNGQRLLLKSGTYWADGSTYETETQSNLKIELKGTGDAIYFIVTTPDGARSWYGNYNGAIASDLTAYYIVRFEDTNGNFITYDYTRPLSKSLCITQINFSANTVSNPTPLNKIVFGYKAAKRIESAYLKGVKVEKTELLQDVSVYTNNLLFKKYEITHLAESKLGYERVSRIQESNGVGEKANPIDFEYTTTQTTQGGAAEIAKLYTYSLNFADVRFTGDFDGDSKLDFVTSTNLFLKTFDGVTSTTGVAVPYWDANDGKRFPATTLTGTKLNQFQSIVYVDETAMDKVGFKVYNYNAATNAVENTYTKTISIDNTAYCQSFCQLTCPSPTYPKTANRYLEGDFNGDGVSEVLLFEFNENKVYSNPNGGKTGANPKLDETGKYPVDCQPIPGYMAPTLNVRVIDLNPNSSTVLGTPGNLEIPNAAAFYYTSSFDGSYYLPDLKDITVADFNGDGKSDIMVNDKGNYKIFTLKESVTAPYISLELIGNGVLPNKLRRYGDFNGDGKTDIIIPVGDGITGGQPNWEIYYSNPKVGGGSFFEEETHFIVDYILNSGTQFEMSQYFNDYYVMDTNGDGKSDLVKVWRNFMKRKCDINNHDTEWSVETYINNIGNAAGGNSFALDFQSDKTPVCMSLCHAQDPDCFLNHFSDSPELVTPVASSYRYDGLNKELLILSNFNKALTYIDFTKDVAEDNLLRKVTQSNGAIVDEIDYARLEPSTANNGLGNLTDFYSSTNSLNYPYVELKSLPNVKLVSNIKNTAAGLQRTQEFKYHGYSVQLGGIGVVGFKQVARSGWHPVSAFISWNIAENDPLYRGANMANYVQMLNNKTFTFGSSYTDLLSKTQSVYTQSIDPVTKRYVILLNKETATDYLTNIIRETTNNTFDSYFLPLQVTTKNYTGTTLEGTVVSETTYETPNLGANYSIGKPLEIKQTITNNVNNDTKTSSDVLTYTNNKLTKTQKTIIGAAETLVEDLDYYPNGNLWKKTASIAGTTSTNAVPSRSVEYTYDTTNRFIASTKDLQENLIATNNSFDPLYGVVLSESNPLGQTATSIYDSWGKRTKVTDFLGRNTTYNYTRTGNIYTTAQTGIEDGSESMVESDALARVIRKGSKDISGIWNYVAIQYDNFGRKWKESQPYSASGSPSQWSVFAYDEYSRLINATSFTGRVTSNVYTGLTASTYDEVMTKVIIKNSNGQVVSSTDSPGGTILYTYDAAGNLLKSDYGGVTLTMQYDAWGRKKYLNDPSAAGIYNYDYFADGKIQKETTPKGTTTYTYDLDRILTKHIVGATAAEKTDILSTYTYDSMKRVTKMDVVNAYDGNSTFEYFYDSATKQLYKTIETTPQAKFTKEFTFDGIGRAASENSTAVLTGIINPVSKKTLYTYKNGALWKLTDSDNPSIVFWSVDEVNARGQLTKGTLGNGIAVTNTYDAYGFPSQFKHDKTGTTPVNVMTLNTTFDAKRSNLMSRYTSLFNLSEEFGYDASERLVSWYDTPVNILNLPFNTTTDGFTFNSTATNGSVTNSAGTLKVVLKNTFVAAQRNLTTAVTTNDKLNVKATITGKTGTPNVIVDAVMVETDPLDATNYVEIGFGTLENGTLNATYTVSNFVTNPVLKLKFVVDENSPNGSNGGGVVLPNATFYVDNLTIDKYTVTTQSYDDRGRITQNKIGTYNYLNGKPYQNSSITTVGTDATSYYSSRGDLAVDYNAFKSPVKIDEIGVDSYSFDYNAMEQRSAMYYGSTNSDKMQRPYRKYYSADGSMEIKQTVGGAVEVITYIGGDAYSAIALVKSDGTTKNTFYLHRDYLGSILAITNASGALVEKRHFDAWGAVAKVQDGAGNNLTKLTFFDRGYTGHEHLQSIGLIHMNGRLYDPKLHRFMQPDNNIQDPYNTQNYNRYSYVLNNPLKYTDETGESYELGAAVVIAVAVAITVYTLNAYYGNAPFTAGGVVKTAAFAALTAVYTFGIGDGVASISNFFVQSSVQAAAHGVLQGEMQFLQGGNFWSGMASGAIASVASSAWSGGTTTNEYCDGVKGTINYGGIGGATGVVGLVSFGTVMGGAGSLLAGGNFWEGAVTGLVVSGLNHGIHEMEMADMEKSFDKEVDNAYRANADSSAPATNATLSDVRSKIPTLRRIYNGFGKKVSLNAQDKIYTASDGADAHTYVTQSGNFDDPYVMFYRASFSSYRGLAHTMLHEFGHVSSFITHNFLNNFNGNKGSFDSKWNRAIAQDELFAHQFAFKYDGIPYKNTYSWQHNYNILH